MRSAKHWVGCFAASAPLTSGMPNEPLDTGPFFHGSAAALQPGDLFTPGKPSNYRPEILMNHVYFTATRDGAGLAAELAAHLADAVVSVEASAAGHR